MKIALSWVGNTGKSTIINELKKTDLKQTLFYDETARKNFHLLPDVKKIQEQININEIERLFDLKTETRDCIIDRTFEDNIVYAANSWVDVLYTTLDQTIYDIVILFTQPIHISNNKNFRHHNKDRFVEQFNDSILSKYWDIVIEMKNWKIDKKITKDIYDVLKQRENKNL